MDPKLNPPSRPSAARLVLVTGPSGAGRSTAIAVLEDLGFESIDNVGLLAGADYFLTEQIHASLTLFAVDTSGIQINLEYIF